MKTGVKKRSPAKTNRCSSVTTADVSGATRTAEKRAETVPLPAIWRTSTWQVPPMLAKIPPENYEATARAFERYHATTLSDDWPDQWKQWCRNILVTRESEKPFGSDLFG